MQDDLDPSIASYLVKHINMTILNTTFDEDGLPVSTREREEVDVPFSRCNESIFNFSAWD